MPKKRPTTKHDRRTRVPDGLCRDCWHEEGAERRGGEYLFPTDGGAKIVTLCDHHWVWLLAMGCGALEPVP